MRVQSANKVCQCNSHSVNSQFVLSHQTNKFGKRMPVQFKASAYEIERALARKGVNCDFAGNNFIAECVSKTISIFEDLFGRSSLPHEINFKHLGSPEREGLAQYCATYHSVDINASSNCFRNKYSLQNTMSKHKRVLGMPAGLSTSHYLHPIVHEFGHGAHFKNIESRGNEYAWGWMSDKILPNAVSRLIAKFKLSEYANYNLKEFMAERISKDICKNLNCNDYFIGNRKNLDYSNIFYNKWNCRYSTPQAYLDYYTQQIWNGDMSGADNVADAIGGYLTELERKAYSSKHKQRGFWGIVDEVASTITGQARWLDKYNRPETKQLY